MGAKQEYQIGNVCISSVYIKEERFKDFRYTASRAARDLGYKVFRNPEDAGSTQETFERYLEEKKPIFVLLIGEKKSDMVKRECDIALSLGLHIITLLQTSEGRITSSTKKFMTSISKATFEKSCSCFRDCEDLYEAVQKRLVEYESERNSSTVNFIPQHAQVYARSEKIIQNAKKRVVLCQRTSSILLGPRKGVNFERDFYDRIIKWIQKAEEDMEFLHVFSYDQTKAELSSGNYDWDTARKKLIELCSGGKLRIAPIIRAVKHDIMPCVICDNNLLVLLQLGKQEYNLLLPHYIIDGSTVIKVVADIQGMTGELLYSAESSSTSGIDAFYE